MYGHPLSAIVSLAFLRRLRVIWFSLGVGAGLFVSFILQGGFNG